MGRVTASELDIRVLAADDALRPANWPPADAVAGGRVHYRTRSGPRSTSCWRWGATSGGVSGGVAGVIGLPRESNSPNLLSRLRTPPDRQIEQEEASPQARKAVRARQAAVEGSCAICPGWRSRRRGAETSVPANAYREGLGLPQDDADGRGEQPGRGLRAGQGSRPGHRGGRPLVPGRGSGRVKPGRTQPRDAGRGEGARAGGRSGRNEVAQGPRRVGTRRRSSTWGAGTSSGSGSRRTAAGPNGGS